METGSIKPFRVVKASDVGVRGTAMEEMIRLKRCHICNDTADREVWIYENTGTERENKIILISAACSDECAEMVAWSGK